MATKTVKKVVSVNRIKAVEEEGSAEETDEVEEVRAASKKRICIAEIVGMSAYSQSQVIEEPKLDKESGDAYDERCWRKRMHVDNKGICFIPALAFKKALESAAGFLRERVQGKGKSEYGKHFRAGIMLMKNPSLNVKAKDVVCERLYVNADGKAGSGSRVWRRYPMFYDWKCTVEFVVVDDTITKEVFERHLEEAGQMIGIGRWRGEVGGMNGRFQVAKTKWV